MGTFGSLLTAPGGWLAYTQAVEALKKVAEKCVYQPGFNWSVPGVILLGKLYFYHLSIFGLGDLHKTKVSIPVLCSLSNVFHCPITWPNLPYRIIMWLCWSAFSFGIHHSICILELLRVQKHWFRGQEGEQNVFLIWLSKLPCLDSLYQLCYVCLQLKLTKGQNT